MESALGWLGAIFEYIGAFVPRPFIVTTVEGGVRWRWGKKVVELKPGFHAYWPLVTRIKVIPVVRQGMIFAPAALITADGKMVSVGVTVVYEIADVVKALTTTDDINGTVMEVGQTAIPPVILGRTLEELMNLTQCSADEESELNQELTEYTKRVLEDFGVKVIYCRVGEFSRTITVRLLKDIG